MYFILDFTTMQNWLDRQQMAKTTKAAIIAIIYIAYTC